MAFTYKELKNKNIADLKEIAKGMENEVVKGYTQMNKDHLLQALCEALNIDMHEHHEVVGVNKSDLKSHIRRLKELRDKALSDKDIDTAIKARKRIKKLKRTLHKATV